VGWTTKKSKIRGKVKTVKKGKGLTEEEERRGILEKNGTGRNSRSRQFRNTKAQ